MSYTLRAWRRQLLSQDRGIVRVHAPDFGVVELAGLVHVYGSGLVNIPGYGPVLVPDHGSRPRTKTPLLPGTTRPGRPTTTHNDNDAYPTIQHNNIDRAPRARRGHDRQHVNPTRVGRRRGRSADIPTVLDGHTADWHGGRRRSRRRRTGRRMRLFHPSVNRNGLL